MNEIETLDSKVVYENRWMKVREDKIRRQNGIDGIYGVIDKPDFVAIIPVQDGHIHLVEQYRYPVGDRYWEIPQGSWESQPDADYATVAAGELKEETGLTAESLIHLGHVYQAYGYSNQGYHIFLATDLKTGNQELDAEEEGLVSKKFTIKQFDSMIAAGEIKDATTLCAYGLAKVKNLL